MGVTGIKYKYAIDPGGKIISIDEVPKEIHLREEYICISCGLKLIAKKGEERKPHFAHYPILEEVSYIEKHCNYESYIHKLAKSKLFELIKTYGLVITVQRKLICSKNQNCRSFVEETINIKDLYKEFDLKKETRISDFIPDIAVIPRKNNLPELFIEIKYSHGISSKKSVSGYPIIEFSVSTEDELEKIESCIIEGRPVEEFASFKNLDQFSRHFRPFYEECPESLYKECPFNPRNQPKNTGATYLKSKKKPRHKRNPPVEPAKKIKNSPFFSTKYTEADLPVKYKAAFAEFKYRYLLPFINLKKLNEDLIGKDFLKLNDYVFITTEKFPKKDGKVLFIPLDTILEILLSVDPESEISMFRFRESFYEELYKIYNS